MLANGCGAGGTTGMGRMLDGPPPPPPAPSARSLRQCSSSHAARASVPRLAGAVAGGPSAAGGALDGPAGDWGGPAGAALCWSAVALRRVDDGAQGAQRPVSTPCACVRRGTAPVRRGHLAHLACSLTWWGSVVASAWHTSHTVVPRAPNHWAAQTLCMAAARHLHTMRGARLWRCPGLAKGRARSARRVGLALACSPASPSPPAWLGAARLAVGAAAPWLPRRRAAPSRCGRPGAPPSWRAGCGSRSEKLRCWRRERMRLYPRARRGRESALALPLQMCARRLRRGTHQGLAGGRSARESNGAASGD